MRRRPLAVALLLLLAAVLTTQVWLPAIGTFLVVRDPVGTADVIIVLAGNAPERLRHASALFHSGAAPLLIVSDEEVQTYGMQTTWGALYADGLSAPDLPSSSVLILGDPPPESTIDEARRDTRLMVSHSLRTAILVTDEFHSRRAALLFGAQFRMAGLGLTSSPAESERYDLSRWWAGGSTGLVVAEEYVKLGWYLANGALW